MNTKTTTIPEYKNMKCSNPHCNNTEVFNYIDRKDYKDKQVERFSCNECGKVVRVIWIQKD